MKPFASSAEVTNGTWSLARMASGNREEELRPSDERLRIMEAAIRVGAAEDDRAYLRDIAKRWGSGPARWKADPVTAAVLRLWGYDPEAVLMLTSLVTPVNFVGPDGSSIGSISHQGAVTLEMGGGLGWTYLSANVADGPWGAVTGMAMTASSRASLAGRELSEIIDHPALSGTDILIDRADGDELVVVVG